MKDFKSFKRTIWKYYKEHGRTFPWRNTRDPYKILVSEIMLQQTQADRVVEKYNLFLKTFPDIHSLAKASVANLLQVWKGLGYNRRALNLKNAAVAVLEKHNGKIPKEKNLLLDLPGIGPATAGDLRAFAWNMPDTVIETNIRSVFIHFFFKGKKIHDKDILPLIEKTVDLKNPREWYFALMDYGSMLKKTVGNSSRASLHYKKQSSFKDSNRKLRADILFTLHTNKKMTQKALTKAFPDKRTLKNLENLSKEGFIEKQKKGTSVSWYIVGT